MSQPSSSNSVADERRSVFVATESRIAISESRTDALSPNGAAVNSQGRQPLEEGEFTTRDSPKGAAETTTPTCLPPLRGSCSLAGSRPRGLRPWLLADVPTGLPKTRNLKRLTFPITGTRR